MKKQLSLLLLCLTGCSPLSPTFSPALPISLLQTLAPHTSQIYTVDMGDPKSSAAFAVKLDLHRASFTTQDSQSGHVAYTIGLIQAIRVFLVSCDPATPPAPGVLTPLNGNIYTIAPTSFTASTQTVLFHHVPPGSYVVAASAFISNMLFNPLTNMSKPTNFIYSEGHVAISTSGGIGNGVVDIDNQYQLIGGGSAPLEVPLALQDETGAKIEVQVNLIDNP